MVDFDRRIKEVAEREAEHRVQEVQRQESVRAQLQEVGVGIRDFLRAHHLDTSCAAWESTPAVSVHARKEGFRRTEHYPSLNGTRCYVAHFFMSPYPLYLQRDGNWVVARRQRLKWASPDGKASGDVTELVVEGLFSKTFRLHVDGSMYGGVAEETDMGDAGVWPLEVTPSGELHKGPFSLEFLMTDHLSRVLQRQST